MSYDSGYKHSIFSNEVVPENIANQSAIEEFLQNERNANLSEPWNKLNKTDKLKKMKLFSHEYCDKNTIATKQEECYKFLKFCIDNKKISKIKELNYDKENGKIVEIFGFKYLPEANRFYLSKGGDNVSTLKNLGPKRKQSKTIKKSPTKHES